MTTSKIGKRYPAPVLPLPDAGQKRRFEGAADGRRASSWISNGNPSVNMLIMKDLAKLVLRSRELSINNPHAKRAPYILANSIVGPGIVPTPFLPPIIAGAKLKEVANADAILKVVAAAWKEWADELSADYNGDFNFYGLQHLAVRTKSISGEVLAIRRSVSATVNKYGFQVLMLEADYIDTTKDTQKDKGGGYTSKGIKYDKDNKRAGYWIYDRHPSEGNAKSTFYEINDVIHLFDVERPGQNRGIPDAASTITTQRDFSDYMDAELVQKKGAACFSAIVQKTETPEDDGDENDQLESLEPGAVQYLNAGESIHFPSLPQNPGLSDFVKVQLRAISAGYLIPYENLTGDLENVTFISGRLGQLDFKKQVEHWQFNSFIPKFCGRVFEWFIAGAKIAIGGALLKTVVKSNWTPPRWQLMDPQKEIAAMLAEVQGGFASWEEKVRENGYDPAEVLAQLGENQKGFEKLGLMPSTFPAFALKAKVSMNQGKDSKSAKEAEK